MDQSPKAAQQNHKTEPNRRPPPGAQTIQNFIREHIKDDKMLEL
jgi:hypothetical protein